MRTNDLINLLSQDCEVEATLEEMFAIAVGAAVLIAGLGFFLFIGFRHDIDAALHSYRFLYKFVVTAALATSAGIVLFRVGRPGIPLQSVAWGMVSPLLLASVAVVVELIVMPSDIWAARMIGHNAHLCLTIIPSLSMGPLACFLYLLRRAAPVRPGVAGAVAGLAAAGIAATFYAANCDDDSPLFVMLWYPIAIAMVAGVGAAMGSRILKW